MVFERPPRALSIDQLLQRGRWLAPGYPPASPLVQRRVSGPADARLWPVRSRVLGAAALVLEELRRA